MMKMILVENLKESEAKKYKVGDRVILKEKYKEFDKIQFKYGNVTDIEIDNFIKDLIKNRIILKIESVTSDGTYKINSNCSKKTYYEYFYITDQMIDHELSEVLNKKNLLVINSDKIAAGAINTAMINQNIKKKIYLASPFFNDKELLDMTKVLGCLRNKGLDVFSPFENQNKTLEFASQPWRDATFKSDVDHIKWCDIVVAIVNGNYMDSGTAWEIGYAYATNKPVVVVNLNKEPVNLMISDSLHAYIETIEDLEKYDFNKLDKKIYENYVW